MTTSFYPDAGALKVLLPTRYGSERPLESALRKINTYGCLAAWTGAIPTVYVGSDRYLIENSTILGYEFITTRLHTATSVHEETSKKPKVDVTHGEEEEEEEEGGTVVAADIPSKFAKDFSEQGADTVYHQNADALCKYFEKLKKNTKLESESSEHTKVMATIKSNAMVLAEDISRQVSEDFQGEGRSEIDRIRTLFQNGEAFKTQLVGLHRDVKEWYRLVGGSFVHTMFSYPSQLPGDVRMEIYCGTCAFQKGEDDEEPKVREFYTPEQVSFYLSSDVYVVCISFLYIRPSFLQCARLKTPNAV